MARIAGSGDGAGVEPERPEKPTQEVVRTGLGSPALEPGEPSWPEDPAALRTEARDDGTPADPELLRSSSPDAPEASLEEGAEPRPGDLPSAEPPPRRAEDARPSGRVDETPSGWDWEAETSGAEQVVAEDRDRHRHVDQDEPAPSVAAFAGAAGLGAAVTPPREEPTVTALAPQRRGGAGALLLGGAVAASLGFGAAWVAQDQLGGTALPADLEERLAAVEARPLPDGEDVEALTVRVAAVESRLAALEDAPAPSTSAFDPEPLREEVATGLAQAQERASALEERLAALEARPAAQAASPADPGPAVRAAPSPETAAPAATLEPRLAAAESSLADARAALAETQTALSALDGRIGSNEAALSTLDARLGEAETRLDDAEAAGSAAVEEARAAAAALEETRTRAEAAEAEAQREAAIAALDSALDAGQPFEAALPALGAEVPEALARAAAEGVPSLAALREFFPEAARAGLAAARQEGLVEDGGVLGFLSGQLSVRSTAPREGSDPDAVLSRTEAALGQGRLPEALAEIDTLPEPVRAAMADWIAQARARAEAELALASLRQAEPTPAPAD